jgi:hypothetical protein
MTFGSYIHTVTQAFLHMQPAQSAIWTSNLLKKWYHWYSSSQSRQYAQPTHIRPARYSTADSTVLAEPLVISVAVMAAVAIALLVSGAEWSLTGYAYSFLR